MMGQCPQCYMLSFVEIGPGSREDFYVFYLTSIVKHSMKIVVYNTYYECAGRHFDDVIFQPRRWSQGGKLVKIVANAPRFDLR